MPLSPLRIEIQKPSRRLQERTSTPSPPDTMPKVSRTSRADAGYSPRPTRSRTKQTSSPDSLRRNSARRSSPSDISTKRRSEPSPTNNTCPLHTVATARDSASSDERDGVTTCGATSARSRERSLNRKQGSRWAHTEVTGFTPSVKEKDSDWAAGRGS